MGHAVHAQDSPVTCRDVRTNAAQQVLRGTHRRHARRVLAGAREAPAGGCSSGGRGSDGKCTLLINRSVVTSPSSLRTSTSAQIAQTAERQLCSRRRLTGDADAAARTAPVGRDGMCTPASRLGPQGGSGRGEQAKVTFGPVLSYPVHIPTSTTHKQGKVVSSSAMADGHSINESIEVQYNDVNYTSKKNRETVFNSINDSILRDFLDNDMDLPCEYAVLRKAIP